MKGCCTTWLGLLIIMCLCTMCTATESSYLLASITFPASGLRIASDQVLVSWRVVHRIPQGLLSWQNAGITGSADHTLYLDGQVVAENAIPTLALENLSPGPHVLRLEAQARRRQVVHEVSFEIVDAPSPWRLVTEPYESKRFYVFDALGRAHPILGEARGDIAFADARGLFEMWGSPVDPSNGGKKRVTLRPWVWEQLGEPQDLPLPVQEDGRLVGPGFWVADRLYAWEDDGWHPLPPLPEDIPEPARAYFEGNPIMEDLLRGFLNIPFVWVRRCGEEVWLSLTWLTGEPDPTKHLAYLARWRPGWDQWEAVAPPTPYGRFVPYCFDDRLWLVNVGSDQSPLEKGQLHQWGWFRNPKSPQPLAANQGIGRTYRRQAGQWEEDLAPPLVIPLYDPLYIYNEWMPSFYGPAFVEVHQQKYWFMVPMALSAQGN